MWKKLRSEAGGKGLGFRVLGCTQGYVLYGREGKAGMRCLMDIGLDWIGLGGFRCCRMNIGELVETR